MILPAGDPAHAVSFLGRARFSGGRVDVDAIKQKCLLKMDHSEYAPASLFFGSTLRLISTNLAAFSPNIYSKRQMNLV